MSKKIEYSNKQQNEVLKYTSEYNSRVYGQHNHGVGLYSEYIPSLNIKSLLDVGCGRGVFVNDMVNKFNIKEVYALDIASVSTLNYIKNDSINFIDGSAHNIPLPDNCVEYVVSFDCLEHCLEEDIPKIVDEFYRVCTKGVVASIATHQTQHKTITNEDFHMTVKPFEWWREHFSRKFKGGEHFSGILDGKPNGNFDSFLKGN
jgi:ubiquinone/menaquinone biosynthesis C-methylase UbiE